ncbi:MAG: hypothetical protein VW405_04010, partial [Rhodospirillaceae bacterium]
MDAASGAPYLATMFRLLIDQPPEAGPDFADVVRFVQRCVAGADDRALVAAFHDATAAVERLLETQGAHPEVGHLASVIAFLLNNPEAAYDFWARALAIRPGYEPSVFALEDFLADDPLWPDPAAYLEAVHAGGLAAHYGAAARRAFDAGDRAAADGFGQRVSALANPFLPMLDDIATCREKTADLRRRGLVDAACRTVTQKYETYWRGLGGGALDDAAERHARAADRAQLATLVAETAAKADAPTVLELGALTGVNLH